MAEVLFILFGLVFLTNAAPTDNLTKLNEVEEDNYFLFIPRTEWCAKQPNDRSPLTLPVPYVVIHHSYIPSACFNSEECIGAMKSMQHMHMNDNGWSDIGYNFAVGSDGTVYEGRGWGTLGAHALHFNTISIGICLIGDWTGETPPQKQLKAVEKLIETGVNLGFIKKEYKLVGHRQVRATECPGEALYKEIQTWTHYSSFPRTVSDLVNVEELPESVRNKLKVQ